jgi:glycosyltransferase involved in cell wall biosynthesis
MVEAAASLGLPAVWVLYESYSEQQLRSLFTAYGVKRIEAAFAMAHCVIPVSHDTAARHARLNTRGNFAVIHNGLSSVSFDEYRNRVSKTEAAHRIGAPRGKHVVLAVGTVCERKGQHTLVEAAAQMVRTRTDFICYLVGARDTVPYTAYVRDLIRRRRLEGIVRLVPETGDVRPYYAAADVFVNASHLEAYSLSILEAEAFGLPIVSTPCPGVAEQVVWDSNALVFPEGDPEALAANLLRLLGNDPLRGEMGRQSRAMFETHPSDEEMLDQYQNVILSAARSGPRGQRPLGPDAGFEPYRPTRRAA